MDSNQHVFFLPTKQIQVAVTMAEKAYLGKFRVRTKRVQNKPPADGARDKNPAVGAKGVGGRGLVGVRWR